MSEPVKHSEIEDVLSSIRRLVSENRRTPMPVRDEAPAPAPDRLVLTPALRVAEPEEADAAPAVDAKPESAEERDFIAMPAEDAPGEPHPAPKETHAEAASEPAPEEPSIEAPGATELLWEQGEPDPEPEPGHDAQSEDSPAPENDIHPDPASAPEPDVSENTETGAEAAPAEDAPAQPDHPWDNPDATLYSAAGLTPPEGTAASGQGGDFRQLGDKIAELEEVIARTEDRWEPDDPDADEYAGTSVETLEWEDADAEEAPVDDMPAFSHHGYRESAFAPRPEDEPEASEQMDDPAPSASEDTTIDEEALRDLVAEIVREELQGALGERITRNVRKLVRREIHRALSVRELE